MKAAGLALAIAAVAALPFAFPQDLTTLRAFAGIFSVVFAVKAADVVRHRVSDRAMLHWPYLPIWLVIPPNTTLSKTPAQRERARSRGFHRLRRGLAKAGCLAPIMVAVTLRPDLHTIPVAGTIIGMYMVYLVIATCADLLAAPIMMLGIDMTEPFRAPMLARSPRDFWGHRWNLFVHRAAFRHIFIPAGGLRHPLRATAVVFLASALMHEYLVWAANGRLHESAGQMTAFFVLHGAAVMVEMAFFRKLRLPRVVAIASFTGFMVVTAPLFLTPMDAAFSFTTWRVW